MIQNDYEVFTELMLKTAAYFGRTLNDDGMSIYWKLLQPYSFAEVTSALEAHLADQENGKFFPLVAHIVGQLQKHDGRPTADECWPQMPRSEAESVVWTHDAKAAYFVVLPLLKAGDEIAARMSFKAAYETQVRKAREAHRPLWWEYSAGTDPDGREKVLKDAVLRGILPAARAQRLLPHVDFSTSTAMTEKA